MADFNTYLKAAQDKLGNLEFVRYKYSFPTNIRDKMHDGSYDDFKKAITKALKPWCWISTNNIEWRDPDKPNGTITVSLPEKEELAYGTNIDLQKIATEPYPMDFSIDLWWWADDEFGPKVECSVPFTFDEAG